MRPHELVMKAFGPFPTTQTVDFDAMGNNVYLISGDTGSGKTTIFDGIMYALYGTASGGGRSNLGTEAFHSDYAKNGNVREEMSVKLTFSNAGRTFTIERSMNWGKSGSAAKAEKKSTLSENGSVIVHGKGKETTDDVTKKVKELLGLDAEQFKRIIMLAQGEFQKFLNSKSDERGIILGKIYDNRRHLDLQYRLKAAHDLLGKKDKQFDEAASLHITNFSIPEEISEEERANIKVNHPLLLSTVTKILEQMEVECSNLTQEIRALNEKISALNTQKGKAEDQNRNLKSLENKTVALEALAQKKEEIASARDLLLITENAAKVIASEKAKEDVTLRYEKILSTIAELESAIAELSDQAIQLQEKAASIETQNTASITQKQERKNALDRTLKSYDELEASILKQNNCQDTLNTARDNHKNAEKTLIDLQARKGELSDLLKSLESAGEAAVTNAQRDYDDLSQRLTKLSELKTAIAQLRNDIDTVGNLKADWLKKAQTACDLEEIHARLNRAFLQGQAGILAHDLAEQLETNPSAPCPVCGTIHTSVDTEKFAQYHTDIPSQDDVSAALDNWNIAKDTASKAKNKYDVKEHSCNSQKEVLLKNAGELLSIEDWDVLTDDSTVQKAIDECTLLRQQADTKRQEAQSDFNKKKAATDELEQLEPNLADAQRAVQDAQSKENQANQDLEIAKTNVENWKEQLKDFPEAKGDAEKLIEQLQAQIETLQKEINSSKEKLSSCQRNLDTKKGSLGNAKENKISVESEKATAEAYFLTQVTTYGFSDPSAYYSALAPEGLPLNEKGLAAWIVNKREEINAYDTQYRDLSTQIKQLKEITQGTTFTDISALNKLLLEYQSALDSKQASHDQLFAKVNSNQKIVQRLSEIDVERKKYRIAASKLAPLYDTATAKFSFGRYVLIDFFRRIIDQANIHLEAMTDGEYSLVATKDGDGRTSLGLNLVVHNNITSIDRDTATLSGGQTFEASLSLALGLSDIVQMESTGTIQIDSMFIDEGFGSLDGARLDKAIQVLNKLSAEQRQIGIISHVSRLDQVLTKKIIVSASKAGSTIRMDSDI